ncbi:MAG: TonB-dependent receptor [Kiritimatiellales bacterium]
MKPFFISALILFSAAGVLAEDNIETTIPVITVTASAQNAHNAGVADALRAVPGVTVNSSGGSIHDISIRGSSFSAAGLSLGGLTLRSPQTEHFAAELPVPAAMLSRPKVNTGIDNQGGHLTGTMNFDPLPITGKRQIEAGFGADDRDWQSLLVQHMLTAEFGAGVFAGRDSANGVDYSDNDYDREYAGGQLQFRTDDAQVDFIAIHQQKEFGARGYYGVNDAIPAKETLKETMAFLSATKGDVQNDYLRAGMLWREIYDDYRMPGYRNKHRTRISSAFVDGRTMEVNGWALGGRVDVDEERVASRSLGHHHRTRGGISLLPQWRGDRWKFIAGLRSEFFTGESPEYLPQAGVDFLISDHLTAFASYNETVRLPSYTELSYNIPGANVGNAALKPQTEQQSEIGLKGIPSEFMDWKASAFYRRSKHTIDWVQYAGDSTWRATDIGALDTYGLEAQLNWYPAENLETQLTYTLVYKDKKATDLAGGYASRYALDYPEHLIQGSLLWRPLNAIEIGTVQALRLQTANHARSGSDFGVDSSLVIRCTPAKFKPATVSLLFSNIWDNDFEFLPGQRRAEHYAGVSLTLNW